MRLYSLEKVVLNLISHRFQLNTMIQIDKWLESKFRQRSSRLRIRIFRIYSISPSLSVFTWIYAFIFINLFLHGSRQIHLFFLTRPILIRTIENIFKKNSKTVFSFVIRSSRLVRRLSLLWSFDKFWKISHWSRLRVFVTVVKTKVQSFFLLPVSRRPCSQCLSLY